MANLLEKASIILTPTAYDDAKVLTVIPDDASGDFDFSRGSAATRVNAQGLVEDVQILSSNLVQNGDFSEEGSEEVSNGNFSQESSELITNGDFSNGLTDWSNLDGVVTVVDGGALFTINGGLGNHRLRQNIGMQQNASYKATYTISENIGNARLRIFDGVTYAYAPSTVGTHTVIQKRLGTNTSFYFSPHEGTSITIDNVSVKEVGQDWTLSSTFSIAENKLRCVSDGSYQYAYQNNVFTVGKTYKVTFDILDYVSGAIRVRPGNGAITSISANGSYTLYYTTPSGGTQLFVERNSACDMSITNISVKEVGQDWNLDSANTSIGENKIIANSSITENIANQNGILPTQKSVILKYDVIVNSGAFRILLGSGGTTTQVTTSGTYTFTETTGTGGTLTLQARGGGFDGSITNISVLEITDDTNLPRINYSGFTYQDSLGSEEIVNGGFDTDSDWVKGTGWSIANGLASCDGTQTVATQIRQNNTYILGKTYKITYTLSSVTAGQFRMQFQGGGATVVSTEKTSNGTYTDYLVSTGNSSLRCRGDANFVGSIDNVSVKEYLGQEVVPDSGCGAWLFEPQSTNLITYSELFSNNYWNKASSTVSSNSVISPNGEINADKLIINNGSNLGTGFIYPVVYGLTSNTNHTYTVFAKKGEYDSIKLVFDDGVNLSNSAQATFDISTGVILLVQVFGTFTNASADIVSYGNGWYKCSVSAISTLTTSRTRIYPQDSTITVGDGTSGVYIWGAQLEQQDYATSYIPTEGTIKTRNQDLCTNGGDVSLINSTEGVLYAEISALADDNSFGLLGFSDGTSNNRVFIGYSSSNEFTCSFQVASSVIYGFSKAGEITKNSKLALKYKENDFAMWLDGLELNSQLSGNTLPIGTLTQMQFTSATTSSPFFGNTKALGVWKEALTDAELRSLTYPTPTAATFDLDFNTIATDFTFTRNSEATFVNAQGLIQSTNELGAEEITNGDFSTDGIPSTTSWSLGWYSQTSNVLISGGKLTLTNSASQSSALAYATDGVSSLNVVTINKTYKLQYRVIENNGVTSFKYYSAAGSFIVAPTDLGVTHTIYIKNTSNQLFLFQNATTNSSISIDNVSIKEHITETNTPRLDYSTGAEAFLLEPQRTNLIDQSNNLTVAWSNYNFSGANMTEQFGFLSPDGSNNATRLTYTNTSTGSGGSLLTKNLTLVADAQYTISFYAKHVSGIKQIRVDLRNSSSGGASGSSFTLTNQWKRYTKTVTNASITNGGVQFRILDSEYAGDRTFDVWGVQLEQASYATSLIPTSGTTVTRNQERCNDATPVINSEEGVLYFEGSALANSVPLQRLSLSDGTTSNRIYIQNSATTNQIFASIVSEGVSSVDFNITSYDTTQFNKIAVKYKGNDSALWINGIEVATDTSAVMPIGLSELSYDDGNGGLARFGNTKGLKVYPKALSDVELETLTSWSSFREMAEAQSYIVE